MSLRDIRRRTAEKMAKPVRTEPHADLELPPGGQAPAHIAERLQAIRARCAASVAKREPEASTVDESRLDQQQIPLRRR